MFAPGIGISPWEDTTIPFMSPAYIWDAMAMSIISQNTMFLFIQILIWRCKITTIKVCKQEKKFDGQTFYNIENQ